MGVTLHLALYKAFHAQKNRTRPAMAKIGLSPGQPKVLHFLMRRDSCMQKCIAEALDIEPATVSRLIANMEQAGMIRRAAPTEDRRAEAISLTGRGRAFHAEWEALCTTVEQEALKGFADEEKEKFVEYLCRMYRNLTGKAVE